MDQRETETYNRGPLPDARASVSVTSAIELAEQQNRQQAIYMAGAAVIAFLLLSFVALQFLLGDDADVTSTAGADPDASAQSGAFAFDDDTITPEASATGAEETPVEPADPVAGAGVETTVADEPAIEYLLPSILPGDEPMTLRGMGPMQIGMTVAEIEETIGGTIVEPANIDTLDCVQTSIGGDLGSPVLTLVGSTGFADRRLARIDMVAGHATRSGIGIGSTVDDVRETYGERIETTGPTMVYVPTDSADAAYRIVIDTVGGEVTGVRNGELPWVSSTSPC